MIISALHGIEALWLLLTPPEASSEAMDPDKITLFGAASKGVHCMIAGPGRDAAPSLKTAFAASALASIRLAAGAALPPFWKGSLVDLASTPWSCSEALSYDWETRLGGTFDDWELLQADLWSHVSPSLGLDGLWCSNPHCNNLSGPCELQLETRACQGGCGVRYCSEACQEQCWIMGHKDSCGKLSREPSRTYPLPPVRMGVLNVMGGEGRGGEGRG